jgi:hypothetical protein
MRVRARLRIAAFVDAFVHNTEGQVAEHGRDDSQLKRGFSFRPITTQCDNVLRIPRGYAFIVLITWVVPMARVAEMAREVEATGTMKDLGRAFEALAKDKPAPKKTKR